MRVFHEGTTKDGREYSIRHPRIEDAESACRYINRLSQEQTFVRMQGEEVTLEEEHKFISKLVGNISAQKGVAVILTIDEEVHGICNVELGEKTEKHIATLGLGVDASSRGHGFGRLLIETAIGEAKKLPGIAKIVLTVKGPNDLARSLYSKLGFVEFGVLPKGTSHRGEQVDQHYMHLDL